MKSRSLIIALLSVIVIFTAFSNPPHPEKMMKELKLTDQQQDQFDKITFDTQKKMIELRAKSATSKLELRRLLDAESIDKAAIEKKMNEIAVNEVAIRMNHLNSWMEKNKALTPEQQKIWKKALAFRPEQMMRHKMMMPEHEMDDEMDLPMKHEKEVTIERRMNK